MSVFEKGIVMCPSDPTPGSGETASTTLSCSYRISKI